MRIPQLEPSDRVREYEAYSDQQRADVIRGWLFDGLTHRQLDEVILGLDLRITKGWQSMGILHHLGLKGESRGAFNGLSEVKAVELMAADQQDFSNICRLLAVAAPKATISIVELRDEEQRELKQSKRKSSAARRKRISSHKPSPEQLRVYSFVYRRNQDIAAEALFRAEGVCELCGNSAPFLRSSDGTPFLEVHHIVGLAEGGRDSMDNVAALCPNCHREAHSGERAEFIKASLIVRVTAKEVAV